MDNVSHSLFGLILGQAGLRRLSPCATAILIVSANAPDVDIVAAIGGSLSYLENHRGYTHSLVFLPVVAALSVLLVAALARRRLPWLRAGLLACVGVASHLLLDWTNSYGIRLLLPFSSRWFHLDWNSLSDAFFLGVLLLAALWPLLANLVGGEIGDRSSQGRAVAIAALTSILLFECGRVVLHAQAIGHLRSRMYGEQQPLQVAALPNAFNPFSWSGVAETQDAYFTIPLTYGGQPQMLEAQTFYKPPQSPIFIALQRQESFRFFAYFARFPVWSITPAGASGHTDTRVDVSDLRFGVPGAGSFHCLALLNWKAQVLESYFTWAERDDIR